MIGQGLGKDIMMKDPVQDMAIQRIMIDQDQGMVKVVMAQGQALVLETNNLTAMTAAFVGNHIPETRTAETRSMTTMIDTIIETITDKTVTTIITINTMVEGITMRTQQLMLTTRSVTNVAMLMR